MVTSQDIRRTQTRNRIFARALLVILAALPLSLMATAAYAYPVETGSLTVVSGHLIPGDDVTVRGDGYAPGSRSPSTCRIPRST